MEIWSNMGGVEEIKNSTTAVYTTTATYKAQNMVRCHLRGHNSAIMMGIEILFPLCLCSMHI